MTTEKCISCQKVLNNPADPSSQDCAGDCLECMADAGDPECQASMYKVLKERLTAARAHLGKPLGYDFGGPDDSKVEFVLFRGGLPVLNEKGQTQSFSFGEPGSTECIPVMFRNGLPEPDQKQALTDWLTSALSAK